MEQVMRFSIRNQTYAIILPRFANHRWWRHNFFQLHRDSLPDVGDKASMSDNWFDSYELFELKGKTGGVERW